MVEGANEPSHLVGETSGSLCVCKSYFQIKYGIMCCGFLQKKFSAQRKTQLFELIGANLAQIQAENLQNVQKICSWQEAPGVNGLNLHFLLEELFWCYKFHWSGIRSQ